MTDYHFTGQRKDGETNLQYHRARWLDTKTANWLSTDPVFDFEGNFGNQYAYVGNNPVNAFDPTGAFSLVEVTVVAAISMLHAGLDMGVGLQILNAQGPEGQAYAAMITQIIWQVGVLALSMLPVIGFFIALYELPNTFQIIVAAAKGVAEELRNLGNGGDLLTATLYFAQLVLAIFEVIVTAVGLFGVARALRAAYNGLFIKNVFPAAGLYSRARLQRGAVYLPIPRGRPATGVNLDAQRRAFEHLNTHEYPRYHPTRRLNKKMGTAYDPQTNPSGNESHHMLRVDHGEALGYKQREIDNFPQENTAHYMHRGENNLQSFEALITKYEKQFLRAKPGEPGYADQLKRIYRAAYKEAHRPDMYEAIESLITKVRNPQK